MDYNKASCAVEPKDVERASAAATLIMEINTLEQMVYSILEITSVIEEKLIGSVPEKEPGITKTPSAEGYFGSLANIVQSLQDRARTIELKLIRVNKEISI